MAFELISKEEVLKVLEKISTSYTDIDIPTVISIIAEEVNAITSPICAYVKIKNIPDVRESWYRCSVCSTVSPKHNYPNCPICNRRIVCYCED